MLCKGSATKLAHLDIAYNSCRHVTQPKADTLVDNIMREVALFDKGGDAVPKSPPRKVARGCSDEFADVGPARAVPVSFVTPLVADLPLVVDDVRPEVVDSH